MQLGGSPSQGTSSMAPSTLKVSSANGSAEEAMVAEATSHL